MHRIKEIFDQRFQSWEIQLPGADLEQRRKGTLRDQGWTINYRFDSDGTQEYIQYFASHRMTNDTLHIIYQDGTKALAGYCQEFYLAGDPQAEKEYHQHNRDFYAQVRELGLL